MPELKTENRRLRLWGDAAAEVRLLDNGKGGRMISGYAVVYNSLSQDLGGFREIVAPTAFDDCLKEGPDVRGRYNHSVLLGRVKSGTVRLNSDDKGLRYEIDLPDTSDGRDVAELIKRGDIDGSSFAFGVRSGGESWRSDNGVRIRTLEKCSLMDVGPVDFPAYLGTEGEVGVRSLPAASRKAAESLGTPNRDHARIRMAEAGGEARFYVPSEEPEDAAADACMQACSAMESAVSVSYKLSGQNAAVDACCSVCGKAAIVARACASLLASDGYELCGVAAGMLTAAATACRAWDHPTSKLAAVVCEEAAYQLGQLGAAAEVTA